MDLSGVSRTQSRSILNSKNSFRICATYWARTYIAYIYIIYIYTILTSNMRLMCSQSPTWLPNSLSVPKHLLLMTGNGSGPSMPMSNVHIGLPWLKGKNNQYDTWNFFRPHSVTWAYTGTLVVFGFCPYSIELVFSNSRSAVNA